MFKHLILIKFFIREIKLLEIKNIQGTIMLSTKFQGLDCYKIDNT